MYPAQVSHCQMTVPRETLLGSLPGRITGSIGEAWRLILTKGPGRIQFWFIALLIGIAAGSAAVLFRLGIDHLQVALYGTEDPRLLHSFAETLPWYLILAIPICGGVIVGFILEKFSTDNRAKSVAEVIEGAALNNGRVETREGLASAVASMITLGTGGSTGREGPVVHLAAVISSWMSNRIKADGITGRDLMGCAVAAAVSASFNAPIAGALFALEVVLRHFAVHAFAPIVIASVAGTVISRLAFGDVTEFVLMEREHAGILCRATGVPDPGAFVRCRGGCDDGRNLSGRGCRHVGWSKDQATSLFASGGRRAVAGMLGSGVSPHHRSRL